MHRRAPGVVLAAFAVMTAAGPSPAQDARALLEAAAAGQADRVQALIRSGAPIDTRDAEGRTALLIAVDRNDAATARALMRGGADINAQAANLDTPWLLAGARGRADIIPDMIALGPDLTIRNRFGGNALIPACERAHVETIRLLLTTTIDVNHVNNLGWTCLLEIVILGDGGPRHSEAARLVLAAGADPNLADRNGVSPLAHARTKGQAAIASMIAQAGGR
jgi:uncharacterized protein